MQLSRWLLRKRVKHILLTSIFTLALILSVVFGSSLPTHTQTPTLTPREKVILEIKGYAKRHVQNNSSMQTMLVVRIYENNPVGLTTPEIAQIYEQEYIRLKKENPWLQLPLNWLLPLIFLLGVAFTKFVEKWLIKSWEMLTSWFYYKLAGSPFLLGTALRRYQQSLISNLYSAGFLTEEIIFLTG